MIKSALLGMIGSVFCVACVDSQTLHREKPAKIPMGFWKYSPEQAAQRYLSKNLKKEERASLLLKKNASHLASGVVEYGGHSNIYGESNQLIRFGERAFVARASFTHTFTRSGDPKNAQSSCLVSFDKATAKADFLARIVAEFRNIKVMRESGDFAISRDSVHHNPPTIINGLKVYDGRLRAVYEEESEGLAIGKEERFTKYAEALLRKYDKEIFVHQVERFDPYDAENLHLREQMIRNARSILADPLVPESFKSTLLRGVMALCIHELKSDVAMLSRHHVKEAAYVREYRKLSKRFQKLPIMGSKVDKSVSYRRYIELVSRYLEDDSQTLRENLDKTMKVLDAVGDSKKIGEMIIAGQNTDYLMYHLYRTKSKSYPQLLLLKLKRATIAYDRRLALIELKSQVPELLLDYLDKTNELEFIRCSAESAALIRERRPEWKPRLQSALLRYHTVVKDDGYWPLDGLEAIVPKDEPRYFDHVAVEKLFKELESNLGDFTFDFGDLNSLQSRVSAVKKRWSE